MLQSKNRQNKKYSSSQASQCETALKKSWPVTNCFYHFLATNRLEIKKLKPRRIDASKENPKNLALTMSF